MKSSIIISALPLALDDDDDDDNRNLKSATITTRNTTRVHYPESVLATALQKSKSQPALRGNAGNSGNCRVSLQLTPTTIRKPALCMTITAAAPVPLSPRRSVVAVGSSPSLYFDDHHAADCSRVLLQTTRRSHASLMNLKSLSAASTGPVAAGKRPLPAKRVALIRPVSSPQLPLASAHETISETASSTSVMRGGSEESVVPTVLTSLSFPSITVGRVSVLLLTVVFLSDRWGLSWAASTAFSATSTSLLDSTVDHSHRRVGLASAAITSMANILSPVLPFTGGVDLRRPDSWRSPTVPSTPITEHSVVLEVPLSVQDQPPQRPRWIVDLHNVLIDVRNALQRTNTNRQAVTSPWVAIPHGGGGAITATKARTDQRQQLVRPPLNHEFAISGSVPFVSIATIAAMTLGDVAETFRYAVLSSRSNFNEAKFLANANPRVREVVLSVMDAVARSRGPGVVPTSLPALDSAAIAPEKSKRQPRRFGKNTARGTTSLPAYGSMDALKFCAAMRIFGEWRVVRQVPEGYKSYAVGMTLGQKDIVQNLGKMEAAVHAWLDDRNANYYRGTEDDGPVLPLMSPTLHDLLQYESDHGYHPALPRLRDRTGSMGLLWVRRQLQYQTTIFHNLQKVPSARYPTSKDAVKAAYHQVYDPFHGWAVQKIFDYSFQAAPDAKEIFKFMNPQKLVEVQEEARTLANLPLMTTVAATARGNEEESDTNGVRTSVAEQMEAYIVAEMTNDGMSNVATYLEVADPLLADLAGLFDYHNMDDPTKV